MKTADLIINQIEAITNSKYEMYSIGLREFPESQMLTTANNLSLAFADNCDSYKSAKGTFDFFVEKGMHIDHKFSLNEAKGVYVIENKQTK